MTKLGKIGAGIAAAILLPPVIAAKGAFIRWQLNRRANKQKMLGSNRRQFGSLPRAHQRAVLYYRRGQLKDLENIVRAGYAPLGKGFKKRQRKFF